MNMMGVLRYGVLWSGIRNGNGGFGVGFEK